MLKVQLDALHVALQREHDLPLEERWAEEADRLVDSMWTVALETNRSPHLCPDRYCWCHVALYQGEPETLWGTRQGW